jgi:hypothetical protein
MKSRPATDRQNAIRKRLANGGNTVEKKQYRTKTGASLGPTGIHWFERPEGDVHEDIFIYVRNIKNRQVRRRYELSMFQQMYCNFQTAWIGGLFSSTASPNTPYSHLAANVIKSCVDTATARIAKSKPRAFVLPSTGDYRIKRKARNLTKFLDGAMFAALVYENSEDVFRDAGIYGTGALLLRERNNQIESVVIKQDELIIDQVTGMYDKPQEMHWEHPTPRTELIALYPEFEKEINDARMAWRGDLAFMSQQDLVMVVETWRTPSTPESTDGRHTVSIANATLKDEEWTRSYIPIYRFHWSPPTYGPFGSGIALELYGIQSTITSTWRTICESVCMFAVPRVWVNSLSGVSQHQITNEITVNRYTGEKPVFDTPSAMAADVYSWVQFQIDYAFKQIGLSPLTAQSEKPAGLNSGVGLRNYQDIETQRFAVVGQRWERWYMAVAKGLIDMSADLYEKTGKLQMKVPGRGFIQTVNWKDVSIAEDQYDVAVFPTNLLAIDPEGRLQQIQEYINSGLMPKDVAIAQLNMPILNDWIDRETAARERAERMIDSILDDAIYMPPDSIGNADMCVEMAQDMYNRAEAGNDGIEEHKRVLLLRFLQASMALQQAANQQTAPPPGQPGQPGPEVGRAPAPPEAPFAAAAGGGARGVTIPQAA